LQLGDIFTAHHWSAEEKDSITETVSRFVEGAPGVGSDDPVDIEAFRLLKGSDSFSGAFAEDRPGISPGLEAESGKSVLDITDSGALVTHPVKAHFE
jgi:hypothetical protein